MDRTNPIPCTVMRGGTSKGLYFLKKDLPEETDVYVHLKEVDLKTNEVVHKTVEEEERGYFFFPSKGSGKKKKKGSEEEENKEL